MIERQLSPMRSVYVPFQDMISRMEREMNSLFSDPFFNDAHKLMHQRRTFPKINVKENKDSYIVDVALPGFDKKDIKLTLESNKLTIESRLVQKKEETNDNFLIREISSRSFQRAIPFPNKVRLDSSESKFKDGLLTVKLIKEKEEKRENEVTLEVE